MQAVVLHPNSNTNSSDKYRVVWDTDWMHFVNQASTSYAFTEHTTYQEAVAQRDTLNKAAKES